MAKRHETPLLLKLKPSLRLKLWLKIMHGVALAATLSSALPSAMQMALVSALVLHYHVANVRLLNGGYSLRYSATTAWQLAQDSEFVTIELLPATVITPFALFLAIEMSDPHTHIKPTPKTPKNLLILTDMLSQDDYRALVVKLRTSHKINSKPANLLIKSS